MTREDKNKLNKVILNVMLNTDPWDLYIHCEHCRSFSSGIDGCKITFYKRQVARYLRKKLGFPVSIDQISHALEPIKKSNYFEIPIDKN